MWLCFLRVYGVISFPVGLFLGGLWNGLAGKEDGPGQGPSQEQGVSSFAFMDHNYSDPSLNFLMLLGEPSCSEPRGDLRQIVYGIADGRILSSSCCSNDCSTGFCRGRFCIILCAC